MSNGVMTREYKYTNTKFGLEMKKMIDESEAIVKKKQFSVKYFGNLTKSYHIYKVMLGIVRGQLLFSLGQK